jgi:phage I-like protein
MPQAEPDELICLRANAPQFDPAKGAAGLPQRILVLPWGEQDTAQGKVICDETTMRQLGAYNAAKNWDLIALDFEHSSVPTSPTYTGEPVKVAGYGKLELVPNEGVYLLMSSWTAEGKEFAAGGHYGDLSPVVLCNSADEVIGLHSVALCRHGATPGLTFLSAAPVGKGAARSKSPAPAKPATKPHTTMPPKTPEELMAALIKLLALATDAGPADVLDGIIAKIKADDEDEAAEGDPPVKAVAAKALSSDLLEIKNLFKAHAEVVKAQGEQIKLLSSGIDTGERAAILSQAARDGKQVPAVAAKVMSTADLRLLCADLPSTVPMDKRTPDAQTLLLSSPATAVNPELAAIDRLTGVSAADMEKYSAK